MQQAMQQIQGMAQAGNSPDMIMSNLEKNYPQLQNNQMWKGLKGKSPQEIEQYSINLINSLGIFNK